ncbi:MAG: VanW family protein [Candidatus Moranbacteria bacterium]|jgi:vancomycin resistance protein YoaR|nr:VanW family protein [Candidatus Moranbacteria bacterium]
MNKLLKICIFILLFNTPLCGVLANTETEKIILKINNTEEELSRNEFSQLVKISTDLINEQDYQSEIENINFCHSEDFFCFFSQDARQKYTTKKTSSQSADREKIESFLATLAQKTDENPINAKLKIEDGKAIAFELSKNGFKLDIPKSIQILSAQLSNKNIPAIISLPSNEIEPKIKEDEISNLGINKLIGEGKSNFRGSPNNRIHNIKVATNQFDGIIIAPGEEFSFVTTLGEVDGEHGYLPELVIKNDKTEPEFGGGICQVSTTAFRAAIYSGLEITARRNHAYPVSYYNPQGMDSTIYIPRPDLRFINNTPGNILIQAKIEGTELTFQFYGTDDKRIIEIDGPHITEKNPDGSLKAYFTQKVTTAEGKTLLDEIFRSSYESPDKYPHPGQETKFTKKPDDWSKKQWDDYKKANGL